MKHYNTTCKIDLDELYSSGNVLPIRENVFAALELCPISKVKVVILGQDPYPTPGDANGLAFSVSEGVKLPRSLINIFKEAGIERSNGSLVNWAMNGVLLLNTCLTVEAYKCHSHKNIGWEEYTTEIIKNINELDRKIIFLLWGGHARRYKKLITNPLHLVLESGHPSPLSANKGHWFGNGHFAILKKHGIVLD